MSKKTKATGFCQHPDRNVSNLLCGAPLPCRWHTVTIDLKVQPPTITVPATVNPPINRETLGILKDIARSLGSEHK